jgi:zinc transport system substrate-binding protein
MPLFFCLLIGAMYSIYVPQAVANTEEKINVFVSILPQKYFVERVGGKRVKVTNLVKPGQNPETYEPTPKQMAALNDAQLYFRILVPFESVWIDRIKKLNQKIKIIGCCGVINIQENEKLYDLSDPNNVVNDPHIWTSPKNAIVLANIIKQTLIESDPDFSDYYSDNYNKFVIELHELDQFIRLKLVEVKNRYLIVSHPSWGHFADDYNFEQISIERHGTEIRAKELSRLINFAMSNNIKTIYVQRQFSVASAQTLAREINGYIKELDPLAEDYIENLRFVASSIAAGAE